jgi:nitrite reductase/ring-hydroxylating ferredoxin subunit
VADDTSTAAEWHDAASLADAQRARPWLPVLVGGRRIAVAAFDGRWFGVADACTHAGCPFSEEADLEDGMIVCNCHGSEFDLQTGAVVRGPAERAVQTYDVRVTGDRLQVRA